MSEYLALAGRITESVDELHRVVDRADHLCKKAVQTGDDDYWNWWPHYLYALRPFVMILPLLLIF